jgi:hypothetical protein
MIELFQSIFPGFACTGLTADAACPLGTEAVGEVLIENKSCDVEFCLAGDGGTLVLLLLLT